MEHQDFIIGHRFMREASICQAVVHYGSKSEEWINNNVPGFVYDEQVYNFIISSACCIHITESMMIYEVSGQWQRVILRNN